MSVPLLAKQGNIIILELCVDDDDVCCASRLQIGSRSAPGCAVLSVVKQINIMFESVVGFELGFLLATWGPLLRMSALCVAKQANIMIAEGGAVVDALSAVLLATWNPRLLFECRFCLVSSNAKS